MLRDVPGDGQQQRRAEEPVHQAGAVEAAEQRREHAAPRCVAEQQRQPRRGEAEKRHHDHDVEQPGRPIEAAM